MSVPRILIQLDTDDHASSFDAITAVDAGVEHLLQYHAVEPTQVRALVHGAIFTRGLSQLNHTAIFVGGSNVAQAQAIVDEIISSFVGPMQVSVMVDPHGCNTTAAAAVVSASRHVDFTRCKALVLGATGPVGRRVARLVAREGGAVRVASRDPQRSEEVAQSVLESTPDARVEAIALKGTDYLMQAMDTCQLLFSCGAAGVQMVDAVSFMKAPTSLKVLVDLNAVPPLGIEGVELDHKAYHHEGRVLYGALGIGGLKMKIHRTALTRLFNSNDQLLDAEEMLSIGHQVAAK